MPRIFPRPYSKDLERTEAPASSLAYSRSFFLSNDKGNFFKLDEFNVSGAVYNQVLKLSKLDMPDWLIEYAFDLEDSEYPTIEEKVEHLKETYGEEFDTLPVGQFAYADMQISKDGTLLDGKQVYGAFIDKEHRSEGLGMLVYDLILNLYGCLISDDCQSVAGCTFWAERLSMEYDVYTYNTVDKVIIEQFVARDNGYICKFAPWSTQELDLKTIAKLDPIPTSTEDRTHIVLFTEG